MEHRYHHILGHPLPFYQTKKKKANGSCCETQQGPPVYPHMSAAARVTFE